MVEVTIQAEANDPGDPSDDGPPFDPNYYQLISLHVAESKPRVESIFAELYTWTLGNYPDDTEASCGVEFTGDELTAAWSPGYRADGVCGAFLQSHSNEFFADRAVDGRP